MREKGCSLSIILLKLYYFVATTIVRTNTRTGDGRIVVRMILNKQALRLHTVLRKY
jgi:hypothetical protein